jgi:1-acyl-sn-glycerol-3-phosphate acyltransferase
MHKGLFPLKFGQKITYTVLDPLEPGEQTIEELVHQIEIAIKKALHQEN